MSRLWRVQWLVNFADPLRFFGGREDQLGVSNCIGWGRDTHHNINTRKKRV